MILERYIHREILEKVGWIIALLLLIVASNRFVEYLADAAAGTLPGDLIIEMLMMKLLAMLPRLLPVAFFLAVMLALSRLARDKELTIVFGAGVSEAFQLQTVAHAAAVFAVLVAVASFYLGPWAERQVNELKQRAAIESDITGIAAGQFKEFSKGDRVVYVEALSDDRQSMDSVFLQVRQEKQLGVLTSDSARYSVQSGSGSRYVLFENGRRYVGTPGNLNYQITEYRHYAVLLETGDQAAAQDELEEVPTGVLMRGNSPMYRAELQWRTSFVIAALLLPLLGVSMSRYSFNEHRYAPVFVAVFVYFIYSNLLGISKTLLKRDVIPGTVGLWWVHLLLLGAIVLILKYPAMHQRLRHNPGRPSP